MVTRYPHTGIISFTGAETLDSVGVVTPGGLTTVSTVCNAVPSGAQYIRGESGDRVAYSYNVFCPLLSTTIPEGAELTVFGKTFRILQAFNFQKHTELKV